MNIASLGNEAICDGQRSYMRWASKIYSFFCLFFVFKRTLIRQITRIALRALLLEEIGNVECGVCNDVTDYL